MIDVHVHNGIHYKECLICGFYFRTKKSHLERRKTCGAECDAYRRKFMYKGSANPNYGNRGPNNPIFVRDEYITTYGYRMIYKPDHPNATKTGHIFEHRYVMSNHLGRPLREDEHVHHIDENRLNNDNSNLQVMSHAEHLRHHNSQRIIFRDKLGRITGSKLKGDAI